MSEDTEYNRKAAAGKTTRKEEAEKRPCLVMIKGDFIGEVYELTNDVTIIGRSDRVDLTISDLSISRRHAMIVKRVDGFHVSDLGSTNGTFLGPERVGSPVKLGEGDKLTLGSVMFRFSFQDTDDTEYHRMLRNMAMKDGLTRVYNQRYFMEVLEKEIDYNRRNRTGLSLVMFDVDHFKRINDTYGHPAGDLILKQLAQLVENEARGYDLFARYGGEEFVFLMRGASLEAAVALAERVRSMVDQQTFLYDQEPLHITTSLGVAHWEGDEEISQAEQLIERVDKQLYRAKHDGRNCVRF